MGRDSCLAMVPASPAPEKTVAPAAANPTKAAAPAALAPGFRFHPTDEELVSYYLKRKILNRPVRFNCISEVDIYKHEPWNLYDKSRLKTRDQEWYFFSVLDKKYGNGARMNRATSQGYWKATGKDREVRHESKLIGMKKTLVFHSGRAPDGQRTNWVMHEYRLVEDEIERIGALQVYVLCRVFHKNNIGPPNGNRYAPFIEEEWDDDKATFIPGEDGGDDLAAGDDVLGDNDTENNGVEKNEHEQEIQFLDSAPANSDEQRKESVLPCKIERSDGPEICVLNREASLPLLQYKRRRQIDSVFNNNDPSSNHATFSENSTGANVQRTEHCSSTTTTAATATPSAITTAISALLEFSSMESVEPRQQPPVAPPKQNAPRPESPVPPTCVKLINELHNEIHKISVERETLKLEMLSAQAMINILQSRIDFLNKENEDLKRRL